MQELKFIDSLQKRIKTSKDVFKGIGDDAAVINFTKDKYLLFASDMVVEGVHFKKGENPLNIGYKVAAVNISDIAAMGGIPKYITVSAALPRNRTISYRNDIIKGIEKAAKMFGVSIVGGDTVASKLVTIDIAIIGEVKKKHLLLRSGAKKGDQIFVTGKLGQGKKKHLSFIPKVKESQVLVKNFKINSMMDISDGLFMDLYRLTKASNVGAHLYQKDIPMSKYSEQALSYGEDFGLLFTAGKKESEKINKYCSKNKGFKAYNIGEIVDPKIGIKMILSNNKIKNIKPKGYSHF